VIDQEREEEGRARVRRFWRRIEAGLTRYYWEWCAVRVFNFEYREGWYLCVAGLVLAGQTWLALTWLRGWAWIPALFANIGIAFAVLHASQDGGGFNVPLTPMTSVYFSFATMMTIGYGDIVPCRDLTRLTVVLQVLVGLYFLAAIVTTVVQWAQQEERGQP